MTLDDIWQIKSPLSEENPIKIVRYKEPIKHFKLIFANDLTYNIDEINILLGFLRNKGYRFYTKNEVRLEKLNDLR